LMLLPTSERVAVLNGWDEVVVVCPFVSCRCVPMCPGCSDWLLKGWLDFV
jgi:hypothetical protein